MGITGIELKELAAKETSKPIFPASGEAKFVSDLIAAHGDDYEVRLWNGTPAHIRSRFWKTNNNGFTDGGMTMMWAFAF